MPAEHFQKNLGRIEAMNVRMDEASVRALRNRVFDHVISDGAWNSIRNNWMNPGEVQWLKEHDFPLASPHSPEYLAEHEPT